ncbi:MAG TPA: S-layer homology domain-containing protein [Bacillota bacterium]|nr:S-layer homology domain-containing protein [Bacillota bacterium]
MRKLLSFALVLVMLLGSFGTVFAAEFSDVADDAKYHNAVAVLSDLDVVTGYPDGTFKPAKVVTRAEMATLIIKALGHPVGASAPTRFPDVPQSYWGSAFIAAASELNVLKGYPDGSFKPDKTVSYDEAITMLVQALGYTGDSITGGYPAGYVSKAKALGILENVTALGTAGANRGDISIMLYNTLTCAIGHTDNEGKWTANAPADNMMLRLGVEAAEAQVVTAADASEALTDISDLIGAYVVPYKGTKTPYPIVAIAEVKSEFHTGTWKAGDRKFGNYNTTGVEFGLPGGKYMPFVNGEAQPLSNAAIPNGDYTIAGVFSGNYLKTIYTVFSWAESKAARITTAQLAQLSNAKLLGYDFTTDDNDEIVPGSFQLNGVDSLDDIRKDHIVSVYATATDVIRRIDVGTRVVSGKVSSVSSAGEITINGAKYTARPAVPAIHPGDEGSFYLDYDGKIFACETTASTLEVKHGVIIAHAVTSGLEDKIEVKILNGQGNLQNLQVRGEADLTFAGHFNLAGWKVAGTYAGSVISYSLNSSGQMINLSHMAASSINSATASVAASGVLDGHYFAPDAFIVADDNYNFAFTMKAGQGAHPVDTEALSIMPSSGMAGVAFNGRIDYVVDEGFITVLIYKPAAPVSSAVYGVWNGDYESYIGGTRAQFMVDGVLKTYDISAPAVVIGSENNLVRLNFDGSGTVTSLLPIGPVFVAHVSDVKPATRTGYTYSWDGGFLAMSTGIHVYDQVADKPVVADIDDLVGSTAMTVVFFDVDTDDVADYALILHP